MATYTAWDGNDYPKPTPEGWYLGTDDRWWPEGHGPGPSSEGPPSTGLSAETAPGWTTDQEATIYSSPAPSAAGATASPDSLRKSKSGNGRTFLVLVAVVVALMAIGGGIFALLGSDDVEETTSTSTLFAPDDANDGADDDEASPGTTEPGDEPTATVSVVPGKGSIEDPYEFGEQIVVQYTEEETGQARAWTIEVRGEARDITQAVLDENQFNDAPPGNQRFVAVPVRVTYVSGPAPASMFELSFKAIGPSGEVLTTFSPSCGVIPDALETFVEMSAGGVLEGNICWSASPEDAADLTMLIEVFFEDAEIYADLNS